MEGVTSIYFTQEYLCTGGTINNHLMLLFNSDIRRDYSLYIIWSWPNYSTKEAFKLNKPWNNPPIWIGLSNNEIVLLFFHLEADQSWTHTPVPGQHSRTIHSPLFPPNQPRGPKENGSDRPWNEGITFSYCKQRAFDQSLNFQNRIY